MTPEILTALGGVIATVLAGTAGLASSRSQRAREDVAELRADLVELRADAKTLTQQVNALSDWQIAARGYITALRARLADHGIPAPAPPPELGLSTAQQEDA